ncbi:LuxR family transcriptional regulator [Rhizobium sp. CFBP 8762]|uniref:helix-turn-helix transcriptional regulator n=1 Tax=Rhizobium sp. CFBP 8762 TaxID=2775279 RepID=UPI00177ED134|nr:LuxR family transcriptional regulator [Rhizobium sp. CFBP 8762]MBD8553323.1 LuxR family transcriptional regulator [Rhizobium sp. CFBP 8762]
MLSFIKLMTQGSLPDPSLFSSALSSEDDVATALDTIRQDFNFRHYMVLSMPAQGFRDLGSNIMLTSWPDEAVKAYDDGGLVRSSAILDRLRRSALPFRYTTQMENRKRRDGTYPVAMGLFRDMAVQRGAFFPVHASNGERGAISFGGDRDDVTNEELMQLNSIAHFLFNELCEIRKTHRMEAGSLSRRETECLHWAAAGKTSTEMASILNLSEYTVNHYLNRATRKLDAVNRVHAVAKALRAGFIST